MNTVILLYFQTESETEQTRGQMLFEIKFKDKNMYTHVYTIPCTTGPLYFQKHYET